MASPPAKRVEGSFHPLDRLYGLFARCFMRTFEFPQDTVFDVPHRFPPPLCRSPPIPLLRVQCYEPGRRTQSAPYPCETQMGKVTVAARTKQERKVERQRCWGAAPTRQPSYLPERAQANRLPEKRETGDTMSLAPSSTQPSGSGGAGFRGRPPRRQVR